MSIVRHRLILLVTLFAVAFGFGLKVCCMDGGCCVVKPEANARKTDSCCSRSHDEKPGSAPTSPCGCTVKHGDRPDPSAATAQCDVVLHQTAGDVFVPAAPLPVFTVALIHASPPPLLRGPALLCTFQI